ncbi:hypothetical protein FRC00_008079 [Tulasnella sp. 408]|nr:hypothetical protein FRC00_008079 [Tulasnella sp. 408]
MPTLKASITLNSTRAEHPFTMAASTQLPTTYVRMSTPPARATQSSTRVISQLSLGLQDMSPFSGTSSSWSRASSRVDVLSAKPYVYAPPRKLSTTLRSLDPFDWPDSAEYQKVARLFENGWKHPYKQLPNIKRIFTVSLPDYLNESYNDYKGLLESQNGWTGVNEKLVFHGTTRSCSLGDDEGYISLCEKMNCRLCCILRTSFSVSMAGSAGRGFNRSGPAIYTSSVSSKADDYTNAQWYSENKVIIVAKAALGKSRIYHETTTQLTASPWGYDSVLGEVGVDLNYDEQVLYKNEAIRPAYIVVYGEWRRQWSVYDDDD